MASVPRPRTLTGGQGDEFHSAVADPVRRVRSTVARRLPESGTELGSLTMSARRYLVELSLLESPGRSVRTF